jgi:hypothetical protein
MKRFSKTNQNAMVRTSSQITCARTQREGVQTQLGTYCGAFRTSPYVPPSMNSWTAPLVAPTQPGPVREPSEYRFASRAPVMRRRSPGSKHPRPKTAHQGQLQVPFPNGKSRTSSYAYRPHARGTPEQPDPHTMRYGDLDNQYDEFLASFQHRIDGMTGQRGGWGF